jgi:hypothetical protein
MRSKKSSRSTPKTGARKTAARTSRARTIGAWTISLVVCVITAVVLIAARQPSPTADLTPAKAAAPAQKTSVERARGRTPAPLKTTGESGTSGTVRESAITTITGCLEADGQRFELKDTAGADVPKARSWKSGFLKKGPKRIDIVDRAGLDLSSHVGQRVTLSGTLADREMQARSIRRVAASCD